MTVALAERVCTWCNGSMVGKKSIAKTCSVACNHRVLAARRKAAKWDGVDPTRNCARCGISMAGKRPHAIYCTRTCKMAAHEGTREHLAAAAPSCCEGCAGALPDQRERRNWCSSTCYNRARYLKESEKRKAYARQYLKDNPERMRAIRRKRKGQLRAERLLFTERDWSRLVTRFRGCCAYCGQRSEVLHREHVIPLVRGGRHSIGNILPACPPCNFRKKTKLLSEWRYYERR